MTDGSIESKLRPTIRLSDKNSNGNEISLPFNDHQKIHSPDVSILIPAFNEEFTIRSTINQVKDVFVKFPLEYEILIINDGSTDSTLSEIENCGLEIINLKQNMGKGYALRIGFKRARGKNLVTIDADGSHQACDVENLLKTYYSKDIHMLIGSRFMRRSKARFTTPTHAVGNRLFSFLLFFISRTMISDSQSGLRVFNKKILKNITLRSSGYEIESELTALALGLGCRVDELPIDCIPRKFGSSNLNSILDGTKIIITLISHYYRGRKLKD